MDGTWIFFGALMTLGLLGLAVVLPIIALVKARSASRLGKRFEETWQKLTQRIHALETQVQELNTRSTQQALAVEAALQQLRNPSTALEDRSGAAPAGSAKLPVAATAVEAGRIQEAQRDVALTAPAPAAEIAQPSLRSVSAPAEVPEAAEGSTPSAMPPALTSIPAAAETLQPTLSQVAPGIDRSEGARRPSREAGKRASNMEEVLGTDWLNKLGMIILVIGVALFLAYEMRELGPAGKVLVGITVGGVFLGLGVFFEQRERWRILARAAMGGGWALLYFTTYAMNHIGAARVLESESWDFVFLLIVAAAMVAHTLRYQSRVVTGLAFLLAFSTINISHAGATSLIASAILAVALVVIVARRRWFDLEVLAIAALFLNHYLWLRPIIEPMARHRHHFPEFIPSAALLIFYWLLFRSSYLLRRGLSEEEEKISTFAALLNSFLLLGVMKYQSVHPEWAFYALLVIGTVELVIGQLPITRRRRTAFLILSTVGATLLVAAFPFRYSGARLSVIWLAEAEALFIAGVFSREILFRGLGIAVELLLAGHMFFVDTHQLSVLREAKAADFCDPRRAAMFGLAALVIFANSHWAPLRWPDLIKAGFERKYYRLQSYLGGFVLLAAIWAVCTEPWLAAGFGATALLLGVVGARRHIEELSVLANGFALLGFLRVIFANFAVIDVSYFSARGVISILLAAALLYAASLWIGIPLPVRTYKIPEAYTWVATFVVALLAWYQLWPASVALGWALIGLVLFQLGVQRRSASLRLQSYALFIASFLRIFFVNFNAEDSAGLLSPRLYTALPLALLFYFVYEQLEKNGEAFLATDTRLKAAPLHCYMGTITVAAAMRFELSPDWIGAAWSAIVCLFVLIAWQTGRQIFLGQALLLGAAVFFRTLLHNFYQRSYFPPPSLWLGGWMTVGTSIALLFLTLLVARQLERPKPGPGSLMQSGFRRGLSRLVRNPEQPFFFMAFILLTGLLYVELHAHGMSTVGWGAEAVGVFLFALVVKERTFRLSALMLLLICVVKIVCVDVWGLAPRDRFLTFIALGVALLSVSFLYTRYKEVLRAYL